MANEYVNDLIYIQTKKAQKNNPISIDPSESAYVGDDVIDLPVMTRIALPIAIANAHSLVKENSLLVTEKNGGEGAVREVCDLLLKAQDKYENLMQYYLK